MYLLDLGLAITSGGTELHDQLPQVNEQANYKFGRHTDRLCKYDEFCILVIGQAVRVMMVAKCARPFSLVSRRSLGQKLSKTWVSLSGLCALRGGIVFHH